MDKQNMDKRIGRRESAGLEGLARLLKPKATWDDLKLPATEMQILREIADQVRNHNAVPDERGLHKRMDGSPGTCVLFAGESGSGKVMAVEAIANELGLTLCRIGLSAVISKYIGEAEKNLSRLFDAAEVASAVLFFDEADALFGKRSEVKESHERYANIEINYLLQQMESYAGLSILATNTKDSIDTAFLQRLRYVVEFPLRHP